MNHLTGESIVNLHSCAFCVPGSAIPLYIYTYNIVGGVYIYIFFIYEPHMYIHDGGG